MKRILNCKTDDLNAQLGHFEKVHPEQAAGAREALEKMK